MTKTPYSLLQTTPYWTTKYVNMQQKLKHTHILIVFMSKVFSQCPKIIEEQNRKKHSEVKHKQLNVTDKHKNHSMIISLQMSQYATLFVLHLEVYGPHVIHT